MSSALTFGHGHHVGGPAEAQHIGGARIGTRLAMGHAHAATGGNVPAVDLAGVVDNGDEAKIVGEHVDVVRWRHRHRNLELSRQIGPAVDRLDNLVLASGDTLAVRTLNPGATGTWAAGFTMEWLEAANI